MGLYFSKKQNMYVHIEAMHTSHIANAVRKIRSGTHAHYGKGSDYKLIELLLELEARNTKQLAELTEQLSSLSQRAHDAEKRIAEISVRSNTLKPLPYNGTSKASRAFSFALLHDLRAVALRLVSMHGHVTADTLRLHVKENWAPFLVPSSFHSLSQVFKDRRFKKIGFLQSKIPSNHGRYISVWGSAASL